MRSRLGPLLGVVLLALTGCEEQEAKPLATSVPTALLLTAMTLGAIGAAHRWLDRRDEARPTPRPTGVALGRGPRALGAIALLAAAMTCLVPVALGLFMVAFGYVDETWSPLSWDDTVVLTAVIAALTVPVVVLHLRAARGVWLGRRWAQTVLGLEATWLLVVGVSNALPSSGCC